jgi:hypothetical protein
VIRVAQSAAQALVWLLACTLLGSCADDDDADADRRDAGLHTRADAAPSDSPVDAGSGWSCTESAAACACKRVAIAGLREGCAQPWPCCFASSDACTCLHSTTCAAQAASKGASVVPHCPRGTQALTTCAAAGENCTRAALDTLMLTGCCEGLVCKPYSNNGRICRTGTADELALAAQCIAAADEPAGMRTALALGTALTSNRGQLPFDNASDTLLQVGPGGCLTDVDLLLVQTDHAGCSLALHAGPQIDAAGALVLAPAATLDARDCSGFAVAARKLYATNALAGTLVFQGVSCESGATDEQWCAAGILELQLTGAFLDSSSMQSVDEDAGTGEPLSFNAAVARLRGRICGSIKATSCATFD